MILLIAAIGWGLFAAGAGTHLIHRERLTVLLSNHFRSPGVLANVLVAVEMIVTVTGPVALLTGSESAVLAVGVIGGLIGLGFTLWVVRLYASGSDLPCACSFSSAPTSRWSVLRSAATLLIAFFVIDSGSVSAIGASETISTLLVGLAVSLFLYVLPDAVAWPEFATAFSPERHRIAAGGNES